MKVFRIVLFILFTIFFYSVKVQGQANILDVKDLSNTNIDSYSDDDLKAFYEKVVDLGLSESQLYKLAADRGLPNSEMIKLRDRIQLLKVAKKRDDDNDQAGEENINGSDNNRYDTANRRSPMQKFKIDSSIFGSELFTENSLVFEPNLRIATPSGYTLGPDDEIVLIVYGYSEKTYNLKINEEGNIYIPNVGPLYVNGSSIEQATEKIKSKLAATIYRGISSGQTKVQITLGKIRSIRVTVIGQARKPGTFTVSSLTTLYNILYLCGGPTAMGSYRAIEIIRGNEVKRLADLYQFLVNGNEKDNILLQEGDVIRIPYYKNRVTITGNVKRPGKFELLKEETFNNLLEYSGGFTDTAYRGAVTVIRITNTQKKIIDLNAAEYETFKSNGSDEYIVGKLQNIFENRISVTGSVVRPGPYQLTDGMTIKSLVEKAGGLLEDAYTKRISVYRYYKNKLPAILSVNFDSVLNNNKDVALIKDDSVVIHSIFEFKDESYVTIQGNVRNPENIKWRENLTLRDALLSAGGLTESGDSTTIEISRRLKNTDVSQANHLQAEIFNINLKNQNDLSKDVVLQPFDLIIIKNLPGYSVQRTVLILGEVKSPGTYSLQNSGDRISDLFKRTGGTMPSADTNSVTIRRIIQTNLTIEERQKLFQRVLNINEDSVANNKLKDELNKTYELISVNLTKALSDPNSSENLILEQGDVLTVARKTNLVKISGEVYYPTLLPYKENTTARYYIKQAGNFTSSARKTSVVVVYPDGKAKSVKHFLFFRSYPVVTPRSEIFVPQKLKTNRARISTGELALIVSALGIVANVIVNLK